MAIPLRYETTGEITIGPFIKSTDGYSALTGLTTATIDIVGYVGTAQTSFSYTTDRESFTEVASGYYAFGVSTVVTQNYGHGKLCYSASSGLPSWDEYVVVPQQVYDSLVKGTGTDILKVDIQQVGGSSAEISSGMFSVDLEQVVGTTLGGSTDLKDNLTTASNMNIGAVAGTTVAGTTDFKNTTADSVNANVTLMAGETVTTDAADNWDNFWFNNDAVSTERVSDLPTTADLLTTASSMSMGAIAGSTVSTATAQLGVNVVEIADETVTTDAADNWDNFWFNNDAVSTERVSELPTTSDLLTTASSMSMGAIAGSTVSTATAQLGVNVVEIADETVTTDAADNWDNFWFNNDAVSTERVSELPTTADLLTTASSMSMGAVAGSTVSTSSAQIGVNVVEFASAAATGMVVGTGTIYDSVMDHGTLMKYLQSYVIGESKVTGASTNQIVYDDEGGSTFWSHTITTATRTFSSN